MVKFSSTVASWRQQQLTQASAKQYQHTFTVGLILFSAFLFGVTTITLHNRLPNPQDDSHNNESFQMNPKGGIHIHPSESSPEKDFDNDQDDSLNPKYQEIRKHYDKVFPSDETNDYKRLHDLVQSIRDPPYEPIIVPLSSSSSNNENNNQEGIKTIIYDVNNCPDKPPRKYPTEWPLVDIIENWNPYETTFSSLAKRPKIYQGLCIFDYRTDYEKAMAYRKKEVPFVLRNDPQILQVVERWNHPSYLPSVLGRNKSYKTEYSKTNHLMFYRVSGGKRERDRNKGHPDGWTPPMSVVDLTYNEWVEKASQSDEEMEPDKPHWYFRVNAKDREGKHFMFSELPFFHPDNENFYIVDTMDTRGINCRFGMKGNIAESHFDSSRNFVMLFGGERRYILSHPRNCDKLGLYAPGHPSARHSALDWSQPDLDAFPEFAKGQGNEVVLQAGDALYLPTNWFHFIISLNLNFQCNARSGRTWHYDLDIRQCGF